jgi:hypothetical protein
LLAAHLAAIAACATATATTVGAVRSTHSSTSVCNQIAGEDTQENPAGVVCVSSRPEYRGISDTDAAIDEPATFEFVLPAPVDPTPYSKEDETRQLDLWFFTGCGLVCFSLSGLRVNLGRKRHRPGARKSVKQRRMMAQG